jgi:methylthioribulose-1-phosphate dehydratase
MASLPENRPSLAAELCDVVRYIGERGWAPGTGGNFSVVGSEEPLRLLITASGIDKETVSTDGILQLDSEAQVLWGDGKPSAETPIHLAIVGSTGARCVLHTHSIWNTLLSLAPQSSLEITGFEMLKGLAGVTSHEHTETVPILDNSQDMEWLSEQVRDILLEIPSIHGVLLRGHGLYTWGASLAEAKRHVEVFEFLFEVIGRKG